MPRVEQAWAGIDAGKGHHRLVVDGDGRRLGSRRGADDEPELTAAIAAVLPRAKQGCRAIDLADAPAALAITLLLGRRRLLSLPGGAVHRISEAYRGDGTTDAPDAALLADHARMRPDPREPPLADGTILELRLLSAHRADLAAERTRNRRRGPLRGVFAAPEPALDGTTRGPGVLIGQVPTSAALAARGPHERERRLRERTGRHPDKLAAAAVAAACGPRVTGPGAAVAAHLLARLAAPVLELQRQLAELEKMIADRFPTPRPAAISSMVGSGDLLGAEFPAATGGGLSGLASADHLAGSAGLAPTPVTAAAAPATCPVPSATAAGCHAPSPPRPCSASGAAPPRRPTTTASGPTANATARPCSPSPAGE